MKRLICVIVFLLMFMPMVCAGGEPSTEYLKMRAVVLQEMLAEIGFEAEILGLKQEVITLELQEILKELKKREKNI